VVALFPFIALPDGQSFLHISTSAQSETFMCNIKHSHYPLCIRSICYTAAFLRSVSLYSKGNLTSVDNAFSMILEASIIK